MDAVSYNLIKQLSLAEGFWFCAPIASGRDAVRFEGFVIPPLTIPQSYSISVNDRRVELEFGTNISFDEVFARVDSMYESRDRLSFSFQIDSASEFPTQDVITLHLDCLQSKSMLPFYFSKSINLAAPEVGNMLRTTHISDIEIFNFTGLTDFRRIRSMLEDCLPMTSSAPPRILDWGCGCGRLSRFMELHFGRDSVFGVDVDPVNIYWDQENLDSRRYTLIAGDATLPYPEQSFDFVYGISVMTHLALNDQSTWLRELHRVLRVGGILILTYHGLAMFFAHVNDGTMLESYLANGFFDYGRNYDLDEGFSETKVSESYRNSFNTIESIAQQARGLFSIDRFIAGGHPGQQDYLVFRRI
jgi:ubiquinone/menaquinone biosynthesis C-methylase UbiE